MGRKAKRAKVLVRKMRITGQEIDPVVARRCGVEKQNQKLIDARLEKEAEEKRIAEEAERKKREAEEAKRKAEEDAKRKAEEAKKKAEAAKKKKAAAKKKAQVKKQSPEE
tara:strand:+ start:685 stop:1014 length:330 start_codon:yes stop_codon:yes gene_type:complete